MAIFCNIYKKKPHFPINELKELFSEFLKAKKYFLAISLFFFSLQSDWLLTSAFEKATD